MMAVKLSVSWCILIALAAFSPCVKSACPCTDESWCKPISSPPRKEILGFVTSQDNWARYNWSEITTLAMFTDFNSSLMCYAHSKGVRVVTHGSYPIKELIDYDKRQEWIRQQLKTVQELYADGINLDIEDPTRNNTNDTYLLTLLVEEVYTAFKNASKDYQVTFDLAWSPDCIDKRCYQAKLIAESTDFVVIMSYDERSQIFGPCIASANSALSTTAKGIKEYLDLGIPPDKLVLGLPWYGYDYPCLDLTEEGVCTIPKVPYLGVNCSDAAGRQRGYGDICDLVFSSSIDVKWNSTLQSPYFSFKYQSTGQDHQMWFDDPRSLSMKYVYAKQQALRGLAFWNVDQLDYGDSPRAKEQTAKMWEAIALFTN